MSQLPTKGFDYDGLPEKFTVASRKRARRILSLDLQAAKNWLETGRLLKEQREAFGTVAEAKQARGGDTWSAWIQSEIGWKGGRDYAWRLIRVYETFGNVDTVSTSLGLRKMIALSTKSTPEPVRKKVIEMAKAGNAPTESQIARMKKDAAGDTRPTPTDAKAKAKETGEVVIGSDDRIYTPLPEDQAEQYQERRDRTYGALDAINEIAGLEVEPEQWLKEADTHWLNDFDLRTVESAAGWLNKLIDTYKRDRRIIENG